MWEEARNSVPREVRTSRLRSGLVDVARVVDFVALALLFVPTPYPSIRLGGVVLICSGVLLLIDPALEENFAVSTTRLTDQTAERLRLALGCLSVMAGLSIIFWSSM